MVRRSPWLLLLNVKGLLRSEPSAVFSLFRGERLVILTESWLSIEDTPPTVPNYRAYNFPRPTASTTAAGGARGGVVVYVSLDLASFATPWPEERYHGGQFSWLRFDKEAGLAQDLFVAACYFKPNDPDTDACFCLEQQVAQACGLGNVIVAW